ncbi:FadR/GntR family transcriptional regulator [Ruania alba]|uniref:GntR family transcriptional regulator, transcriptional repressor for pyruvate dehydrogenase complex n=1 Tax=Ruania alba TaxID=648782 RepID=A0A1H5NCI0_9MICO|nr:FCD domain-containing protein [Ruania alba]SEE99224.1 GntR family transcriptional regulator, transcriptional repressor for pyruvate dehydrogenase complex [Ruania alba]
MSSVPSLRRNLSGDLAQAVVALVEQEGLRPGDPLESLKALAARFDVAVPTMREALRRLEGLGLVDFRHGSGIYVGINAGRRVLANPVQSRPDADQLVELLEARRQIEPSLAMLAAQVRDEAGIALMEESLASAQEQIASGDDALWLTNLDFHRAVAAAGGNSVLVEVLDSIVLVHAEDQREILRLHGDASADYAEHARIAECVRRGDPQAARDAAYTHLDHVVEVIRARRG